MKVLVIGGGPSGLLCAIKASEKHQVILIEKNEKVGKKIYITGKGRCNVTNNCSNNEFINNVVSNPKFLYSSINRFSCSSTMDFFSNHGVYLVTERGNRVFPYSYHASDITKVLVKQCENNNVQIHLLETVLSISKVDSLFIVKTNKCVYQADALVIATGGLSYPQTGSTGDGYKFAKEMNIEVVSTHPSLVPLKIKDYIPKEMFNATLKNVTLTASNKLNNKIIKQEFGELTFNKDSISGPIGLTISSYINKLEVKNIDLEIDLKPALSEEQLYNRITNDILTLKKKSNSNSFILVRGLVFSGMISMILKRINVDSNLPIKLFNEKNINDLIKVLKHFKLEYIGLEDYNRSIVTSGGVSTKEINPQTMESKKVSNLYFVGEVLDVDALTGGFNMQIAFSTGFQAGNDICNK